MFVLFFLRLKQSSGTEIHNFIEILTGNQEALKIQNRKSHSYSINMFWKTHQNE